jgi:hypothetical protein
VTFSLSGFLSETGVLSLEKADAHLLYATGLFKQHTQQRQFNFPSGSATFQILGVIAAPALLAPDPVPLPPACVLFGTGLLGLVGLRRFRKS